MQNIDWNSKKAIAKRMNDSQLEGAMADCLDTAKVMGSADMIGKDASYYMDEASIYHTELKARKARRTK